MSSCRVYVGRLSYQAREKDVERFFRGIGRVRDINLKNGFGFVEFDSPRDAEDAVYECNGQEMLGERIIVEHARGSSAGYGGRGHGGGRGGYDRDRGRYGGRREPVWLGKYGPPTRTEHRIIVENISSRISWQVYTSYVAT
jgi:arginine/serine-rich splicing factor 4/5/6